MARFPLAIVPLALVVVPLALAVVLLALATVLLAALQEPVLATALLAPLAVAEEPVKGPVEEPAEEPLDGYVDEVEVHQLLG